MNEPVSNKYDLSEFLEIEHIALFQSFRLSGLSHLSVIDRLSHIRCLIHKCFALLEKSCINALIFGGNPHSLADFILARITSRVGISCYTLQDFPVAPLRSFVYDIKQSALPIPNCLASDNFNHSQIKSYAKSLSQYFEKTGRLKFIGSNAASRELSPSVTSCSAFYANQESGLSIYDQIINRYPTDTVEYEFCFSYYSKISALSRVHDFNHSLKDTVALFLHVEPEAAVNPGAGLLISQLEIIRLLRTRLPYSINLLVKEHPSMFVTPLQKGSDSHKVYRSSMFFNAISSMPGVYWLNPETRNSQIFSNCLAAVSCGGTTAFESFVNCCPIAVTGYSPLSTLPEVFELNNLTSATSKFWNVEEMRTIRKKLSSLSITERFERMLSTSVPGHPNGPMMLCYHPTDVELETSQEMLVRSIVKLLSPS
ncbi:hypothetical protein [Synechococcus sp. BS55D]|uniref:hypothetical protein n=1 Tax=Synechococcus sp. BS55D TaxID=2055943 RepID=UPI001038767E|nr:hypothetical protein [Synechococcus sp. BS55D]